MATKKNKKSKTSATRSRPSSVSYQLPDRIDPRKKLLARVAGNVAGSLVATPSPSIASADKIAEVAVDIAEEILRKAGIAAEVASEASVAEKVAS